MKNDNVKCKILNFELSFFILTFTFLINGAKKFNLIYKKFINVI